MPLSRYIPTSAIARPGVCTSTTRPASPFEGQVIYQTDTDQTFVWNGSAWVLLSTGTANPPGLEHIASTTFSTTTTPFINGCFTSTYDHYRIMISAHGSAATTDIRCRLRSGTSTAETGSVYDRYGFFAGATYTDGTSLNQTNAFVTGITNVSSNPGVATIDIFNPNIANVNTNMAIQGWYGSSGILVFFNNRVETNTQYTGFEMTADSGTLTGTIRVYGYRN